MDVVRASKVDPRGVTAPARLHAAFSLDVSVTI